jgi:hypothetical protein
MLCYICKFKKGWGGGGQGAVILYMERRPFPSVLSLMSVFCVHLLIYQQLQLQYINAGGRTRLSQYKSSLPLPYLPARKGRTPC